MEDLYQFLVARLKVWAYSPTVLRDVALMVLVVSQMWLMARYGETIRKFRRSVDAANGATQTVLDVTAAWGKRIEELEARIAALEQGKPHLKPAAQTFFAGLRKPNGDARLDR